MSNAHRPTWAPALGKESKSGSRSYFQQDYSARTKLKFRAAGQTSAAEVEKRDLKAELLRAEREAVDKKRKAAGLAPLVDPEETVLAIESTDDEQARKRRKILEEAVDLDKDDESDEDGNDDEVNGNGKSKGKGKEKAGSGSEEEDDDDSDEDSDEEDDTAALMAELNKIKQERAEEKARIEAESNASASLSREAEIAAGNPLLNLAAALGQSASPAPSSRAPSSSAGGSFAVKRRWDDDLIFKNQASGLDMDGKPKKEFVNDLLRTEFHRKFMQKFIK